SRDAMRICSISAAARPRTSTGALLVAAFPGAGHPRYISSSEVTRYELDRDMSHYLLSAEPGASPSVGDLIAGKYRLDSIIGTGGMGKVFSATHVELGQRVAIKVLTVEDDDARRDEARERFLREGRATAALVSDHVVRVYDVGTLESGAPFMVMELLRGQDLALALARGGPLAVDLAAECVRQAAEAIACAHEQGIVHRDLKPSNLFLTQRSDGSALVKVLDFGISKNTQSAQEPITGSLTETRSVLGTPFYMSPEQVRDAKKVDFRTDIWSLGLILHELLSGSPAFEGTTLPGVCASIAADPPAALRLKRAEVPVELEAVVLKCLEKDPARRFQAARELIPLLATFSGRPESSLPSPLSDKTIRSSPMLMSVAALRDNATLSAPDVSAGTMASAVLTQSGERVITKAEAEQSKRSAALASTTDEGNGSKRTRVVLTVALVAALGALLWSLSSGRRAPEAALPIAPLTPAAPTPASSTPSTAPARQTFALLIDSSPSGAQVYEGQQLLGSTPIQLSLDAGGVAESPRTFTVRKAGLLPYTIVQGGSTKDVHLQAELVPDHPAPAGLPAGPKKPRTALAPSVSAKPLGDIFMQR
ncbi:MAG TPA: serine/threonine-protein kinase, partial [Polyangiaceae bacterium]